MSYTNALSSSPITYVRRLGYGFRGVSVLDGWGGDLGKASLGGRFRSRGKLISWEVGLGGSWSQGKVWSRGSNDWPDFGERGVVLVEQSRLVVITVLVLLHAFSFPSLCFPLFHIE